ncbi:uncharacterized protein LOC114479346 [Gouania willdenowi]|uniref:Uncharacterized protein n=1 Tax=Gouania willdenowi TaxID=441366 RepID=A0A8C5DEE6_GOUWI|nr:uncharacterized protein C14orf93 homolog [Gouania willdenowi]
MDANAPTSWIITAIKLEEEEDDEVCRRKAEPEELRHYDHVCNGMFAPNLEKSPKEETEEFPSNDQSSVKKEIFSTGESPAQRFAAEHTGSPATESEKMLLGAISGLSRQLTQMAESMDTRMAAMETRMATMETRMATMETRMVSLEESVVESRASNSDCSNSKKPRRAHNSKIAGTVRFLHNSKGNDKRYDPKQGLSSPYNLSVTSYLVETLAASPDMCGVDTGIFTSACKTYYETVRKNFRFSQPDLSAQADAMKGAARSRQRRKRLLAARMAVLTKEEMDLWRGVTVDMMSDEEDDVADGEAGWIVRPPSFRSQELTALCSTLQKRLEKDPKYQATHHKRLHYGPPSKRPAPSFYDPEAAKRHMR